MHERIQRILNRIASAHHFVPYTTLSSWETISGMFLPVAGFADAQKPDKCIFWFHHEEAKDISVAFVWYRKDPDLITSMCGFENISVKLGYVSSHQKLKDFFKETKDRHRPVEKKRGLLAKLLGRD